MDVNGDGKVDLVSGSGALTILTNNGSGGLAIASTPSVGGSPTSVTAASVNGDGKVDLITANQQNHTLSVMTNDGRGNFSLSSTLSAGSYPYSVTAADVNGDGKVDLISANSGPYMGNTLLVFTNNGSGGFGLATTLIAGSEPFSIAAADLTGDGRKDLISANAGAKTLSVFINTSKSGSLKVNLMPLEAVSAGAQWQMDSGGWQNSGSTLSNLTVGSHAVSFKTISGWAAPNGQSPRITNAQTTTITGAYTPLGSLQVAIAPADAVSAGAEWQVDGGSWQTSGAAVAGLTVGSHTVSFNNIHNWITPAIQNAVINYNQTTTNIGTYSPLGALQANLGPPAAVNAGAQWRVDGGAWQASGAAVANLTLGSHTLSFSTVANWATPTNQAVAVNSNQTTTVTVNYGQLFGSLQVNISPAGAVSAGARWRVDGGAWQNSGTSVSGLTLGSHTVSFSIVSGWGVPVNQIVTVDANQTTTATAIYLAPHTATAAVITTNGFVVAVTITDAGIGYTNTPLIRLIGGGGSGAQAGAVLSNGVLIAVSVLDAGFGYTNAPVLVIDPPFIPNPVLGIAPMSFLAFSNLALGGIYQLQQSVAWYWSNQPVSFMATNALYTQTVAGVAGSGDYRLAINPVPAQAFAIAAVDYGFVVGATVTRGGSGYITSPAVTMVGGGGTNATAVSQIAGGVVTNVAITSAGIGYTNPPTVQIDPPPAAAVSPAVLPVMRLDSASLAPYHNYQIQFKSDIGGTWADWNGGLFMPTDVTNSQYVLITNGVCFFRLQYVP